MNLNGNIVPVIYADDTSFISVNNNIELANCNLTDCGNIAKDWFYINHLMLNESKTYILQIAAVPQKKT